MSMLCRMNVLEMFHNLWHLSCSRAASREAVMRRMLGMFVTIVLTGVWLQSAAAQDVRENEPGKFDYYLLALAWSPSFCETAGERKSAQQQCGERPYSFVVHGLWPQYESGFPEFCQNPAPRLDRNIVSSMLDMMPSPRLIFREWDRHGVCSGLPARGYFDTVRKARAMVKIPPAYLDLAEPKTVSPAEVEEAFVAANPGLTREAVAIGCDSKRLNEVRICLSKDFKFRNCAEVDRR